MPIGFANSILAQGTTATGANSFVGWDGSNDHTFTRSASVNHFIGFAPFANGEYGVMISCKDGNPDQIQYDCTYTYYDSICSTMIWLPL